MHRCASEEAHMHLKVFCFFLINILFLLSIFTPVPVFIVNNACRIRKNSEVYIFKLWGFIFGGF